MSRREPELMSGPHKMPYGRSAPGGRGVNGEEEAGACSLEAGLSLRHLSEIPGPPQLHNLTIHHATISEDGEPSIGHREMSRCCKS